MAQVRGEAWLTCVTTDDAAIGALVLAESLRRTRTTRRIGVIISKNVSKDKRIVLRKAFDALFLMDDDLVPEGKLTEDDRAKIYAFSLRLFDKCVFVSPNSMVLENVDKLFEGEKVFKFMKHDQDGFGDMTIFMFTPCLDLCEYLGANANNNGNTISQKYLETWMKNQQGSLKMTFIPENTAVKFSIENGYLMTEQIHAPIVQFVDTGKGYVVDGQLSSLLEKQIGLPEKLISELWLEIFHQKVAPAIKDPKMKPNTFYESLGEVYENEPIAIIGMSCRFPGANNLEEFWNLLFQGEEGISNPPSFRWTKEHSIRVSQQERKTNAGFLGTSVDEFDAKFFGVSPKEAQFIDPQARLLHEVLWNALENSGVDALSLYGSHTGIFTGSWMMDYKDIVQSSTERDFFRTYMGSSIGGIAARLSFLLGLTGPSVATESGCSSAIVALDLAIKSLRSGESNLALAGGVNLLLHPFTSNIMEYVISPEGRCKTFDANANGFARAEGCGVLVLKRLSDALRDRDNIWSLIRGSAISQEGMSKSLGTPTVHCEGLAMELALKDAGVRPEQVTFIEAHGTGTAVGDPMEVAAIAKAYHSPARTSPLVIGSVKTNVGHTESCSGITGIIKCILAMQHELIPKHLNLETLNPEIHLDAIPAVIPLEPIKWPKVKGQPRFAGVSSFGITGTDGHVILQEPPDYELPKFCLGLERPMHILKISGKSKEALDDLLMSYENMFASQTESTEVESLANTSYTANTGRATFDHRAFLVAESYEDALKTIQSGQFLRSEITEPEPGKICFLFTGQGSQYNGMAKTLYETCPVFRVNFDACDRALRESYNVDIKKVLWETEPDSKELSRTIYSQTSIFCVEYCLLRLWESWGLSPDYVLGHSLGEFAAAVAGGILDFKDALKLVAERSRLIDSLPRGSMLVIKGSEPEVKNCLKAANIDLDFAAINSPEQTVVAGDTEKILAFLEYCKGQGMKATVLEATHAFHSRHMDAMLEKFLHVTQSIRYKDGNGKSQYVSGMEGRILDKDSWIDANYWIRHTRQKVSFLAACHSVMQQAGCCHFLEVGPQPILSSFVMMNNENLQISCYPSLRKGTNDWRTILTSLGKLYLAGFNIDWRAFDDPYKRKKISLPFYPFHRKSFWVESNAANDASMIHPLVGYPMSNASTVCIFQNDLKLKSVPFLKDHCIGTRVVYPGAGFLEMSLVAGYCAATGVTDMSISMPKRAMKIENFRIDAPLQIHEEKSCRLQVIVDLPVDSKSESESQQQGFRVKVFHQNTSDESSGKWTPHTSSTFFPLVPTKDSLKRFQPDRIKAIIESNEHIQPEGFYKQVDDVGLRFGETFRSIKRYWSVPVNKACNEVVSEIRVPEDFHRYLIHPLILDAMFQTGILTKDVAEKEEFKLKVPVYVGHLTFFSALDFKQSGTQAESEEETEKEKVLLIHSWVEGEKHFGFVLTPDFIPLALIEDVELLDTTVKTVESILEQQTSSTPDAWEEVWKVIPGPFTNLVNLSPLEAVYTSDELATELALLPDITQEEADVQRKCERLIYLYIVNAFYDLGWNLKPGDEITVKEFCDNFKILPMFEKLVRFYFSLLNDEDKNMTFDSSANTWKIVKSPPSAEAVKQEIDTVFNFLEKSKALAVVKIYQILSNNLTMILRGEESALAILFPTEEDRLQYSASTYYQNYPGRNDIFGKTVTIMRELLRKTKEASDSSKVYRILEVGSGTGSMSQAAITLANEIWGDQWEYYYTDISQSFFIKAEKRFENWKSNLKFSVFNIEENPIEQGIPVNYFDIVIATDVLHATRNLSESLIHLRQSLRPHGTICFTETITQTRDITFVFGLLEGYWRYEDFHWRPHHCCVSGEVWQKVMEKCGFHSLKVTPAYLGIFGCITAEASPDFDLVKTVESRPYLRRKEENQTWVVFSTSESQPVHKVCNELQASGNNVIAVFRANDDTTDVGKYLMKNVAIRKLEAEAEDIKEMEAVFQGQKVKGIVFAWGMDTKERNQKRLALPLMNIAKYVVNQKKPPRLYGVTQGVHSITDALSCNPSAATIFGMMKSLKNENSELFVRCIDLEHESPDNFKADQILFEIAMKDLKGEANRAQIAYRDNLRYEPRFVKGNAASGLTDQLQLPPSCDRYHLVLPQSRLINDLTFDTLEPQEVGDEEVEVKIKAFALNFKDILTIMKPSAEFEKLNTVGLDYSGIVIKLGKNVQNLKIGDRIFGCNFKEGQLPSHLVVPGESVIPIPERISFWEATTLSAVFATSCYSLLTIAKMKKGETVLIHTGSGGVGLASIQLAKHVGANIITTAGNPRKRAYLRNLGIEHVFNSRTTDFGKQILEVTNGRGVDIVLNSITGPGLKEASLNACAKNARFVEMSKLAIWTNEEVKALRPDVDYTIVDLTGLEHDEWSKLLASMKQYLLEGNIKPIPYVKFDALFIRQALQYFQKAKHIGKVLCAMPEVVMKEGQYKVNVPMFNSESTYLITGGLGGIGFEVAKWMLEKGAQDIVLTGRNPPKPEIAESIKHLNSQGYNLMVKYADVGDYNQIKAVIDDIVRNGKPLRGVQHCAGVLRDNMYANQTWESFNATFIPKVVGTWNLHDLTKDMPLEHFVFYSSIAALMGTPGQPNHAASNCFEDAFAHYRFSLGLPATSVNWGQWAQVGCAKEINLSGVLPVSVKRMLSGLEITLKTQKVQICYGDFESFATWTLICPLFKAYMDERLWKQLNTSAQSNQGIKVDQFWEEMDAVEGKAEKFSIVSDYLKRILRSALRLDADETIKDDSNIQDLGVDSLMLIELKNSIQTLLGSRVNVTANLLKNCNTVREIANALVSKIMGDGEEETLSELTPEEFTELLQKDCQLPEDINIDSSALPKKSSDVRTILITGVTGQLGPYVIAEVCKSYKSVERIVCLIRSSGDGRTPEDRLKQALESMNLSESVDMSKVKCVQGEVALPQFGLEEELYKELCESIDAVIHCAVKSNHVEAYRNIDNEKRNDIRSVNVGGTLNVLRFASITVTKHVYYASAFSSIFGVNDEDTLSDNWPQLEEIKIIVDNKIPGYQTTKYVCEILLKEANSRGIPCKVFRFPWITGDSKTGQLNYTNNHYILRFLTYIKLKVVTSIAAPAIVLPVDTCAELSLKLFLNDEAPYEIFNIGHPSPQVEQEFVQVAKEDYGIDLEVVEYEEFAERLQKDSPLESLKELYTDVERVMKLATSDAVQSIRGYYNAPDTFFVNKKVSELIPGWESKINSSMDIIRRDLKYVRSTGFFEKLGIL